MVAQQTVDAKTLTKRLAEVLVDHLGMREIWMSDHRDVTRFWIITTSLSSHDELGIYGAAAVLRHEYPGTRHEVFAISPDNYPPDYDLSRSVPSRAQRVTLHRDE